MMRVRICLVLATRDEGAVPLLVRGSSSVVSSWMTRDAGKRSGLGPLARRGTWNVENRDAVTSDVGSGAVDRRGVLARTWNEG